MVGTAQGRLCPPYLCYASRLRVDAPCQLFRLAKLALRLEPELLVAPGGASVLFPDFAGAAADALFARPRQHMGAPLQLARKAVDAFRGFAVADPTRVAPVLVRLGEKAADKLLAIHMR